VYFIQQSQFNINPLTPEHFAKKCLSKRVKPSQLSKFGHAQKAKFRESFAALSSFTFCFLPSPLLLLFFPPFFSFVGHLLGYLLVGKDFAKRSRMVNFF